MSPLGRRASLIEADELDELVRGDAELMDGLTGDDCTFGELAFGFEDDGAVSKAPLPAGAADDVGLDVDIEGGGKRDGMMKSGRGKGEKPKDRTRRMKRWRLIRRMTKGRGD